MSTSTGPSLHLALIMDGNGRWARARGLPRVVGHREGARAVRRVVEASPGLGIGTLTLYAFSSDNWARPATEVAALMSLFERTLASELDELKRNGVRLDVIGRRDRLSARLVAAIEHAESETSQGSRLHLRLAVDYSARDALTAAARLAGEDTDRAAMAELLARVTHASVPAPDVDLLVRTGGEQRLSDFLLWECAYAELVFTERAWPDFDARDLAAAVDAFHRRERRFGRVPDAESVA